MDWDSWTDGTGYSFSSDELGFVPDYSYDSSWSMEDGANGFMGASGEGLGGSSGGWLSSLGSMFGGSGGSNLFGGLLGGLGSMFGAKQKSKMSKDEMKYQEQMAEKLYQAKLAEDEKYYQQHGQQLGNAYQGYKKYYGQNPNPTGLLNFANLQRPGEIPAYQPQYQMPQFNNGMSMYGQQQNFG